MIRLKNKESGGYMEEVASLVFWETIVIGAGSAGLFFAANQKSRSCLVLEKTEKIGQKMLLSGGGACNLTHAGNMKDFVSKYGEKGKNIRTVLYKYNNEILKSYIEKNGVSLIEREDGKIFPKSMKANEIKSLLEQNCRNKQVVIKKSESVTKVEIQEDKTFIVNEKYKTSNLVIATGGVSYPETGSDGEIFKLINNLGMKIVEPKEALVPLEIKEYPFRNIEGVAVKECQVKILDGKTNKKIAEKTDDLLFTKKCLSGPVILNISRYYEEGRKISLCFTKKKNIISTKNINQSILNFLTNELSIPKSLTLELLKILKVDENQKASAVASKTLRPFVEGFVFELVGTEGFNKAMATAGGVDIEEMNTSTFESKKIKGLYIIGEALDIDGDTGGYNLQFAFSSAMAAAESINNNIQEKVSKLN